MFQDFITSPLRNPLPDPTLEQYFLLGTLPKHLSADLFSSIFQPSLEQSTQQIRPIPTQSDQPNTFSPSRLPKPKKKRIRKYTSNNPNNLKGHWTNQQNLQYHYFLELNALYFIDDRKRKTDKMFKSMAAFIQTRQSYQCRSHHQKVQKKWGSFHKILLKLRVQNFKKTEPAALVKQLQQLGYKNPEIISQHELLHSQNLYKSILNDNESVEQKTFIEDFKIKDSKRQQFQDELSSEDKSSRQKCLCLMMSDTYEDQLEI